MGGAGSKTRARPRGRSSTLADRPTPPGKPQLVPCDKHSPQPDVVTIRWEPPLYDGGSWITGYLVEHRRTGSPHWVRSWPQLVRETELTLSGLEPGWRYQFRVSAQNVVGLSDPGELSDLLTVTLQRTAASAPFFVKELQDTNALENEKAELSVQVRGTPTPTIAWFKDGVEVFSSRSYRVITDNEISTLVIHQAALSDEGEIKCAATNRVGYTFSRAKLIIQAPPNIRLPRQYEEGLLFEKDEVIRLKVSVAGRPVPEVTWALNGEPVPGGGRYEAAHSERYATLRVGEARRSDRGEYTVRAVNLLGEDTASFLVTVADKPMPPGRAKVVMTLGRSVTLSWTSPEDDGGCKIGNYIVEYYRLGWNMWLKAATCRQLTTTLGELIEGSEYKFRVKAENPYGVSEPSSESDVVFIPDPKRGLLEPPEHGSVKAEDMDVWLEDKKRALSASPSIDEQYGERKTKKKRGPTAPPQERQTEKHSMMSEDSMSPPATPDRLKPTIPRRRPRLERSEVAMEALEEKELTKKLEERRKVDEFKKFEEIKKAEELRKMEEQKKEEESKRKEENRLADIKKKKKEIQQPPQTPRLQQNSIHGSSELMLVLLPHSRATTEEREASKRELFESSLALEDDIAPPMSLSAPELGTGELPEPPPVRSAFSSTELLHDRAMARFYQDQEREEAESSLRRRGSLQRRASLERRPSRTKASSLQDLLSVTKPIKEEEEEEAQPERPTSAGRKSPRLEIVRGILTSERVEANLPIEKHDRKTFSRESMDSVISTDDVRRKLLVQQTSEEDMEYEDSSFDEDEEDEYDEEEEEPITDDIIDEELEEDLEEEEEEDLSNYDKKESFYTSESEEEVLYSYSLEEDTYIPTTVNMKYDEDTMISAYEGRGPLILGSKNQPSTSSAIPMYPPIDDLMAEANSSNGETKLKPILKRPSVDILDAKKNELAEKRSSPTIDDEFKNKNIAPEKRYEPNFNPTIPKPILKVREPSQEKQLPVTLKTETELDPNRQSPSKTALDELSDQETGSKKKQVRIEEPEDAKLASERRENNARSANSGRQKSDSSGEEVDGSRVLISHYSDIVAEYSRTRRPPKVPLYLDYESLKAAAEKEEENLPPIIPDITVDEPDPEPELYPEQEPEQELELQLEPIALNEPEPEPELESKRDEIEEPVKLHRHSVHFEPLPEETKPTPKPTEKIRGKSPSRLKKRSPSPMKKISASPQIKRIPALEEISDTSVSEEKTEPARTPSPVLPPRLYTHTEKKVHSFFDFMMDLSLFILACWLYLFKDERLAIPVLCLMIYRQAHDAFLRKMEALRNKLPRRVLFWRKD